MRIARWLLTDVRYAARALVRVPGFTLVAVLSLALAIGANAVVFSFVNATLVRPLPVVEPDRLVRVFTAFGDGFRYGSFSYPDYQDYKAQARVFDELAAYDPILVSLGGSEEAELLQGAVVTGNYFAALGVDARLGRPLVRTDDEQAGGVPAAVISHGLWERRFAANPTLIGSTVRINGVVFTVVGVAPERFTGTDLGTGVDVWVPMAAYSQIQADPEQLRDRGRRWLSVIGRLSAGTSRGEAEVALRVLSGGLARAFPATNKDTSAVVTELGNADPRAKEALVPTAAVLLTVVTFVLLIACANVGNLVLLRSTARRKEMAIWMALGLSRWRLISKGLTEAVLLGLAGGLAGLLLAYSADRLLLRFLPATAVPIVIDFSPDRRVLLYTLVVSLVTGVLCGLVPALQLLRRQPMLLLKDEVGISGYGRSRSRGALVAVQVTLSVLLLIGASLFLRSLYRSQTIAPGFTTEDVALLSTDLTTRAMNDERGWAFLTNALDRLRTIPGVASATVAEKIFGDDQQLELFVDGYQPRGQGDSLIDYNVVGPDYLATMAIPVRQGRDFKKEDDRRAPQVAIINVELAQRYFPNADPIGRRLSISGPGGPFLEIVGVAQNAKYYSLQESPLPYLYLPVLQHYEPSLTFHVRTTAGLPRVLPVVRATIRELDPDLPLFNQMTLADFIGRSLWAPRLAAAMLGGFGVLALGLAVIGIYSVVAHSVSRRTREIALRLALGADRRQVLNAMVRHVMTFVIVSTAVGLVLALLLGQAIAKLLYETSPFDPVSFIAMPALLLAVASASSYLAARGAANVELSRALRDQ